MLRACRGGRPQAWPVSDPVIGISDKENSRAAFTPHTGRYRPYPPPTGGEEQLPTASPNGRTGRREHDGSTAASRMATDSPRGHPHGQCRMPLDPKSPCPASGGVIHLPGVGRARQEKSGALSVCFDVDGSVVRVDASGSCVYYRESPRVAEQSYPLGVSTSEQGGAWKGGLSGTALPKELRRKLKIVWKHFLT